MTLKLSHSSVSRYLKCAKSYEIHYKQKLRPTGTSAALLFGSALDEALNSVLLKDGKDPYKVFMSKWDTAYINKIPTQLKTSTEIAYAQADFDSSILTDEDLQDLSKALEAEDLAHLDTVDPLHGFDLCLGYKKQAGFRPIREAELRYLNQAYWLSCSRRAKYIIDAYQAQVMPRIVSVQSVQKTIELKNEGGDSITGFIDLIATLDDGKTYILDNKTSSRPYKDNSVRESPQLALYGYAEEIQYGGFIVMLKSLKKDKTKVCSVCGHRGDTSRAKTCDNTTSAGKRCNGAWDEVVTPKAEIQIVLDQLPQTTQNLVLENFKDVNSGIKAQFFPKNLHTCDDWYGQPCPYKGVCWANSLDGLAKVE